MNHIFSPSNWKSAHLSSAVSFLKLTGLCLGLCLAAFCLSTVSAFPQSFQVLPTGGGPEDMVIDSMSTPPRLLVSCASRRPEYPVYGEIEAVDPVNGSRKILKRIGEPAGLVFRPHGISMAAAGELQYLYVISHNDAAGSHPIIKYQVDKDALVFVEILESRLLVSPNALQAYPDGSIVVCNDAAVRNDMKEKIFYQKKGNILLYDGRGNWSIVASKIGMPAGLAGLGSRIFVSAALENKLYEFKLDDGQLTGKRVLSEIKGPDNIRFHNGRLLVTSHYKPFKFIGHTRKKSNISPSLVLSVDPATGKTVQLFQDNGRKISAASVAVIMDGKLIIGQIFEPFIVLTGNK